MAIKHRKILFIHRVSNNLALLVIPQGTVDNNLGPDRLAGPKALDTNYCRQPTLWLHDLSLEVLTLHGTELVKENMIVLMDLWIERKTNKPTRITFKVTSVLKINIQKMLKIWSLILIDGSLQILNRDKYIALYLTSFRYYHFS